jgi:hypothetical protein
MQPQRSAHVRYYKVSVWPDVSQTSHADFTTNSMKLEKSVVERRLVLMEAEGVVRALHCVLYKFILTSLQTTLMSESTSTLSRSVNRTTQ